MPRYISPRLFSYRGIYTPGIFELTNNILVKIIEYRQELFSTINLNSPIVILREGVVDEYLLDDLEMLISADKEKLDAYLRASSLYANIGERVEALMLIEGGIRPIPKFVQ